MMSSLQERFPGRRCYLKYQKSKIVALELEAQQQLAHILLGLKVRLVILVLVYHLLTLNLIKNRTRSTISN
jgi:hypothetical protein